MGFLFNLKKLLGISGQSLKPGATYADFGRKTRTGKLRAKAGPFEAQEELGTDKAIFQVEGLSDSSKKVYRYLSGIGDKDGYRFPFYKTIAQRTKLSESTVSKALKELEEFDLIDREQRVSRRGGSSNLYHVKRLPKTLLEMEQK